MAPQEERPPGPEGELRNKDETEVPIGDVQDPEMREYTMWRCGACGEMGELRSTLPEACPACAAPREELFYREED